MLECDLFLGKRLQQAQNYWALRAIVSATRGGVRYTTRVVIMTKVIVWIFLFLCTGGVTPFIMANNSIGTCDVLAYAQGVNRCELSVMEINFDQTNRTLAQYHKGVF